MSDTAATSLEEAQQEINRLEDTNAELRADLEECKDQLFELLQKSNDIPEQAIKDAFSRIIIGIESWVDDISGEERFTTDFRSQYQNNLQSSNRRNLFKELGLGKQYSDITWQTSLGQFSTCHNAVLCLLIARWLVDYVFLRLNEPQDFCLYPLGLSMVQFQFIQTVEDAMNSMAEEGDVSQSGKWRGETLSALATTQSFQDVEASEIRKASDTLRSQLGKWVGSKALLSDYFPALQQKVLEPAAKLAQMASCSSKTYSILYPFTLPEPMSTEFGSWNFKNLDNWRTATPKDLAGSIIRLYPGIVRKGSNTQDDLLLVKPVALGYQDPRLQPKPSSSRSSSPQSSSRHRRPPERDLAEASHHRSSHRDRSSPIPELPRPAKAQRRPSPTKPLPRSYSEPKAPLPRSKNLLGRIGSFVLGKDDTPGPTQQPSGPGVQSPAPGAQSPRSRRQSRSNPAYHHREALPSEAPDYHGSSQASAPHRPHEAETPCHQGSSQQDEPRQIVSGANIVPSQRFQGEETGVSFSGWTEPSMTPF